MSSALKLSRILLPTEKEVKWAVIACDQFTSDRDYWRRVEEFVGTDPSTLHFILPEAYLGEDDEERIKAIHANMISARAEQVMYKLDRGMVLTERSTSVGVRRGLIVSIDLEAYTFEVGKTSPIRSSEAVVPERLPARVAVRRGAVLEFPHALVFYKDKKNKLMKALYKEELDELYSFELMENGGDLAGYFIPDDLGEEVIRALETKEEPRYAIADGNHSIAAAKAYWEELKPNLTEEELENHPARYCLVELVNIYDQAVNFLPIHRLMKGVEKEAFCSFFKSKVKCVRRGDVLYPQIKDIVEAVSTVDKVCEEFAKKNYATVDYIHGDEELRAFASEEGNVGIMLPAMEKENFFEYLKDGKNLPKKTFSIGEGREKRYYMEGREISYD